MGRPWLAGYFQYQSIWIFWVNFNSPLLWDVFAISTYLSVSLVFWWTGYFLILQCLDRAITPFNKRVYSILSFGWSGRAKDWQRFGSFFGTCWISYSTCTFCTYYCIDGFCYFCNSWLAYNFPSIFVAGAVFSGFAMVNTLLIIMRKVSNLEAYIYNSAY
jgi:molybdopterin-containing oxidoreductase family membrane subunit